MIRWMPVLLVALLAAGCSGEVVSGTWIAEANRSYEAGDYAAAVTAYQAIVDAGTEDGTLFYNLGNAYFKTGELGRAIANYRRAQTLMPRDPDVAANLSLARAQTRDQLASDDGSPAVSLVRRLLVDWTTANEVAFLALVLWMVLCLLVVVGIAWPGTRASMRPITAVVCVLLVLAILSLGVRWADGLQGDPAVIVAQAAEARSGPGDEYLTEFTLHAGAELRILEQRSGWVRAALPGDLQGWLLAATVEKI
jgi:tetratricopeptide (TPR) repeat protein